MTRLIESIDRGVQDTAASAEELSGATEELAGEGERLREVVGAFHVDGISLVEGAREGVRRPGALPMLRR